MGHLQRYIQKHKKISIMDLEKEQAGLIKKFEKEYDCTFILYVSCTEKFLPENQMNHSDFEIIYDLLKNKTGERIAVYLETNGGSGQAAKEIADFLHDKFEEVHFVITGQAKSAGTILALSGNEILMTGSGALGPIDAQVKIGRSQGSAHGYLKWVEKRRKEAIKNKQLNPFDAQMVAQIPPQELEDVFNAFNYAKVRVKEWLPKYKFKNWKKTQTRGIEVTDQMRKERAEEIARDLTDQGHWLNHGESIRVKDLEAIKLLPIDLDKTRPELADIIYRLQAINRIIFGTTTSFKFFITADERINRNAVEKGTQVKPRLDEALKNADVVHVDTNCEKCGTKHTVYLKFKDDPNIDRIEQQKGHKAFPKNGKLECPCGQTIDLTGFRSNIEQNIGKKVLI